MARLQTDHNYAFVGQLSATVRVGGGAHKEGISLRLSSVERGNERFQSSAESMARQANRGELEAI